MTAETLVRKLALTLDDAKAFLSEHDRDLAGYDTDVERAIREAIQAGTGPDGDPQLTR